MPVAKNKTARRFVTGLCVVAVIVAAAGMHHQRSLQDATVDWQHVSAALMEVENAKADLHKSLQQRIAKEQESVGLRQQ